MVRFAWIVSLVLFAGSCVAGPAAEGAPAAHRLAIDGYIGSWSDPALIDRSAAALTTVGVDGVNLRRGGASITRPGRAAEAHRLRAHRDGLRAELLVGNYASWIGDFSERLAHRLLGDPARIRAVARAVAQVVRLGHWDGVQVDLESLLPRDAAGLDRFLAALRARLPRHRSLSICLQVAGDLAGYLALGYHLHTIGRRVDRVTLMAYDEHGPWENRPGPVGGLHWTRKGLRVLLLHVPASKVDLGVAGYGYAWRPHANVAVSDAGARRLAGGRAHWRADVGEWTAHLRDGSTLWWSDRRSLRIKERVAAAMHLHGLAVWSLGTSDPIR